MKVAIINTYDTRGGAARAAYRLHQGLKEKGNDSSMFVLRKLSKDTNVFGQSGLVGKIFARLKQALDYLILLKHPGWNKEIFSVGLVPSRVIKKINILNPDIINLHWINSGFINIEGLASFKSPIIWTMHDMWAFTGGCHYDNNCGRFKESCGSCPLLGSNNGNDLSYNILKRKEKSWKDLNIHFVAPSNWLAECARSSSLLKGKDIRVIPNGLDFNFFKPVGKQVARKKLNLPLDKKIVLFGAVQVDKDKRKGYDLFLQSLDYLLANDFELLVFGKKNKNNSDVIKNFKVHYLGEINNENLLMAAYSAADVLVMPSLQENLSNMVVEAMACNIPVVAFDIGGMPDMIQHKVTGWLAKSFDPSSLAVGINWSLKNFDFFSNTIRESAMVKFDLKNVSKQYCDLYQEVIDSKNKI